MINTCGKAGIEGIIFNVIKIFTTHKSAANIMLSGKMLNASPLKLATRVMIILEVLASGVKQNEKNKR